MTEPPRYPEVTRGHTEVSIAVEECSWTRVVRLTEAEARLLHARLGAVLGTPAPAPSEPLAWVVFADEDGESDLKDHEGASVDCLVFAKEKDAQDCADDGRYDDQEPRRILPLYPAAHAPDEARLKLSSRRPKVMAVAPGGEP